MPTISEAEVSDQSSSSAALSENDGAALGVPSHEEEFKKPEFETQTKTIANSLSISEAPKGGIEVVALRKGFYNQYRIREGERFKIRSLKEYGRWMQCVESKFEKQAQEFLKAKKARK